MSDNKRFSNLEPEHPLPSELKIALSKLNRFKNLEIGSTHPVSESASMGRVLCCHCGKPNEEKREYCWACFKAVIQVPNNPAIPAPGQEIAVVLNGTSYTSSDPKLPEDVRVLMEWIRREGYSPELLSRWQQWVNERQRPLATHSRVEAWQGQRISVLRIDGKLYKSDDPGLPPEIQEIFGYIERDGVTPALIQHLQLYGTLVKYRPLTTPMPSDGDMHFWGEVKKHFGRGPQKT